MEYQKFKEMLKARMQDLMGDAIEVGYETYTKNNQTEIEAMTFKEKEPQAKTIISPAIHLQDLYELYKKNGDGETFTQCLHQIQTLYLNQEPKSVEGIDDDWEEIRRNINLTLMHEEWNQKWLEEKQVPYSRFLDFAITLRRTVEVSPRGIGTIAVTKELMECWDVTEEALWEAAWNNLYQEKFLIDDLDKIVKSEVREEDFNIDTLDFEKIPPMYIISNQEREYGARAILRMDILHKISRKLDCNLYILPSSTHEIILVPDDAGIDVERMRESVRSINESMVPKHERLSDEVYYFGRDKGILEIVK